MVPDGSGPGLQILKAHLGQAPISPGLCQNACCLLSIKHKFVPSAPAGQLEVAVSAEMAVRSLGGVVGKSPETLLFGDARLCVISLMESYRPSV